LPLLYFGSIQQGVCICPINITSYYRQSHKPLFTYSLNQPERCYNHIDGFRSHQTFLNRLKLQPTRPGEVQIKLNDIDTYSLPLAELAVLLKADLEQGLSIKNAEERLQAIGPNLIPEAKSSFFRIYISPLLNWLVNIYLIVSTILACIGLFLLPEVWKQLIWWFSWIGVNAAVAIIQQALAQKKLHALQRLSAPRSKVFRDGEMMSIASEEIVPGDIVKLEQGDSVPADSRIITASNLIVNESALTGESEEVEKLESGVPLKKDTPISGRRNMVFRGTNVNAGSARVLVLKTGTDTQLGAISESLVKLNVGEIPLRRKVNAIAKYLGFAVLIYLVTSLAFHMISLYTSHRLFADGVLDIRLAAWTIVNSLTTAMSIMPINIPLLTTIILLTGVLAMAKHKVIIRDLNAVESLGRVSVVCTDKTGTLTKDEMTVKWICIPSIGGRDLIYGVTGVGFEPTGVITEVNFSSNLEEIASVEPEASAGSEAVVSTGSQLECLLVSGMLNNDSAIATARVNIANGKNLQTVYKSVGDATDAAILALFCKAKLDPNMYKSRFQEVRCYTFDSKLKRMTKVFKDNCDNRYIAFTKGATEVLLPHCDSVVTGVITKTDALHDEDKNLIRRKADIFASFGYRVISFAFRYLDELPPKDRCERDLVENGLAYLGFVAIIDPPRDDVRKSIIEAKNAGIKPVMITGDSLATAKSVAMQVGIAKEGDLAVEAHDIERLTDEELLRTTVFARISPEHKMAIVERYKIQRCVVAATGDGINDAPAVLMADVGVAMGITGTDVTKQAADMVITDDSFNSVIEGIREGRGLFQKIRSVIFFYIAVNFAEALIYYGSSFFQDFNLLNSWQKIYIFALAHSIPPLALIVDRLSNDVMKEKPRDAEGIFNKPLIGALILFSASLALVFCIVYFGTFQGVIPVFQGNKTGYIPTFSTNEFTNSLDWAQAKARTMLLTVALIAECLLVFSLRRLNKPITRILREDNNWIIWPFILLVPLAHLVLMYFPAIQVILGLSLGIHIEIVRLTSIDWAIVIILAALPTMSLELFKIWLQKKRSSF
jgi:P-type Ca2+ transporter type 2C